MTFVLHTLSLSTVQHIYKLIYVIQTGWPIYASVKKAIIGSDNGVKPMYEPMQLYC